MLLVGAHFSHLELSSRLVSQHISITGMYRVMDNDVLDWFTLRSAWVTATACSPRKNCARP